MRWLRFAALAFALAFGTGCFVLDELDAGMEIMESHTPADKKKPKTENAKAGPEAEKPPTYQQAVSSWFGNAKTLSKSPGEDEGDDPVVSCRHAGKTLFTKRSACLARGGEAG